MSAPAAIAAVSAARKAWEVERAQQREKEAKQRLEAAKKRQEEGEVVDEKELQQQATESIAAQDAQMDDKALE
eukprot:scaffold33839_cov21-Tisochrysis_lutea.AAC.5